MSNGMKNLSIPPSTTITRCNSTKSVNFSPKVKVIFSLALDDFTDEEIDSVWITSIEDKTSKEHIVQTLKVLCSNGGSVPLDLHSDFSALGLEGMASHVQNSRMPRKTSASHRQRAERTGFPRSTCRGSCSNSSNIRDSFSPSEGKSRGYCQQAGR